MNHDAASLSPPSRGARLRREARKLALAVAVFGTIVGGYMAIARTHAATVDAAQTLPEPGVTGDCALWFVGSSTMFKWTTLRHDMRPWEAHDRGVNGATIDQLVRWFGHDPAGPAPAAIIWYAGENDIAYGKSGMEAFAEFEAFMEAKTRRFGGLPVVAISLKPSPARWKNRAEQTVFNDALRRYAASRADLGYVDIRPLMFVGSQLGPFYVEDGVHMNAAGYARWTTALQSAFRRMMPAPVVRRCGVATAPANA